MIHDVKDLHWSFDDNQQNPRVQVAQRNYVKVDPTPGYPHNKIAVSSALTLVKKRSGHIPKLDVNYYLCTYESLARTNAWAANMYTAYSDDGWESEPVVFMSGKRIPPHPAVTRYLTAHEYGHHVQWAIEQQLDIESEGILDRYAEVRGLEQPPYYGPGTWHVSPCEVFADDFRILVARTETEYWPHSGIEYPHEDSAVGKWWKELIKTETAKWAVL